MPNENKVQKLFTVNQFLEKYDKIPYGCMQFLLFNKQANGLNKKNAIVEEDKITLIDEERFFDWLTENELDGVVNKL